MIKCSIYIHHFVTLSYNKFSLSVDGSFCFCNFLWYLFVGVFFSGYDKVKWYLHQIFTKNYKFSLNSILCNKTHSQSVRFTIILSKINTYTHNSGILRFVFNEINFLFSSLNQTFYESSMIAFKFQLKIISR